MPVTEKHIEQTIVNYVQEVMKGEAKKLRIDGENGFPDRTILVHGNCFFMEVKKPGGEPSDKQLYWLRRLNELDQGCYIVDSFDDAKEIIDKESLHAPSLVSPEVYERCVTQYLESP